MIKDYCIKFVEIFNLEKSCIGWTVEPTSSWKKSLSHTPVAIVSVEV